MGIKTKLAGLGAALALGLTLVGPAAATPVPGQVNVSIQVTDQGASPSLSIDASSSGVFSPVTTNAVGSSVVNNEGVASAGDVMLTLNYTGDNALYNANGFYVTVKLAAADGSGGAYLSPLAADASAPTDMVSRQIPGRYLSIVAIGNPQQAKYTSNSGQVAGHACTVWSGTVSSSGGQCAPRAATGTKPIYQVGDPAGVMGVTDPMGNPSDPNIRCQVTTGDLSNLTTWDNTCLSGAFSSTQGIAFMHFRPGSGTVQTKESLKLHLNVPAGVYPSTYSGILTFDQVNSI